jgi:hypothetical protein
MITQIAIWYYTESWTNYDTTKLTPEEYDIYDKLVNTTLSTSITNSAKSNINLYISDKNQHNYAGKEYQNLLTVETSSDKPVPDNGQKSYALTLEKIVKGNDNATDEFKFTITLSDKNGKAITGTKTVTSSGANITSLTFDSKGVAEVNLKGGQSITIKDLSYGTSYKIVEDKYNNYTTQIDASAKTTIINNKTRTANKKFMSANETVTYTNTYNEQVIVPPTGVRTDTTPLLIMTGITMAGIVLMVRRRITKGRWV